MRGFAFVDMYSLSRKLWPDVRLYSKQRQILRSVDRDDETVVVAGNELGKDFVGGMLLVLFCLTRHPFRVVTTSAKDDHLRVLWGEAARFLSTSAVPLLLEKGGTLVLNHQDIRRYAKGQPNDRCPLSYCVGMVAGPNTEAAMQGHHVADVGPGAGFRCCGELIDVPQARTLFVSDESSSVPAAYFGLVDTWAKRKYIFGNPWDCDNYFRWAVEGRPGTKERGGSIPHPREPGRYKRRVLRIRAEDSPNVRYGLAQLAARERPDGRTLVPGVKGYFRYVDQRKAYDPIQAAVSLDAVWYRGSDVMLFPADWLEAARRRGRLVRRPRDVVAEGVGIDPGEGKSSSSLCAVDKFGPFKRLNLKTPNTASLVGLTINFLQECNLTEEDARRVAIDRGGGGKQLADQLREKGWDVRTVGFGEAVSSDVRRRTPLADRRDAREGRTAYVNRRAEMYGDLAYCFDPSNPLAYSFHPQDDVETLFGELLPVPKRYDAEGRLKLLPKNKREAGSTEPTLTDLIGHSPDEADALALARHAAKTVGDRPEAGVIG